MTAPGRFLIVSWDGGGNVPPAVNLAARLVADGHCVRVLGWPTMEARVGAAGAEFATYPSVPPWPADLSFDDALDDLLVEVLDGRHVVDDIVAEATRFSADVVVVDCMMRAAWEAARLLGLPAAVLVHHTYYASMYEWGTPETRADKGRFYDEVGAVLVTIPPGFDPACELPANTSYVGPITDPRTLPALDPQDTRMLAEPGDPWALLSLSTTLQGQAEALPRILTAIERLPVRVFLTLGGVLPPEDVVAPPNVVVREFVPHELLLPHMAAVVTHAGLSTVMAALTAGVPLLCLPQGRDQLDNAQLVEACGVGYALGPDASPDEIAVALERLIEDRGCRREAARFATTIDGLDREDPATRILVGLLPIASPVSVSAEQS